VALVGAVFWRRATTTGALASIAVRSALVLACLVAKGPESELPIYAGLTSSVVAFVLVSLATEQKAPGAAASRRIEWG
jgi:SSS family solute:Na+ symporter